MIEKYYDIPLMIWLASFPRSGNTFFRNVLYEVYGISSSTYHKDSTRQLDDGFADYPIVKTHLLPDQLPPGLQNCKSVYLVRDGRDALVSIAHHRKDIVAPGSDYFNNLLLATLALNDSYFGGWSSNVQAWISKADIVIKFEDLIRDPIGEVSKLSAIIDLPPPNIDKLPDFKTLKFGSPQYGSGGKDFKIKNLAQKHFRKGKVGGYQTEMPFELQQLFWDLHGPEMHRQGYVDGQMQASGNKPKKKVLLEVSKALTDDDDGVKRYLLELIEHLTIFATLRSDFQIDLLYNEIIRPLYQAKNIGRIGTNVSQDSEDKSNSLDQMRNAFIETKNHGYEYYLLSLKAIIKHTLPRKIYQPISQFYRAGPFRRLLTTLRMKITHLKQESIRRENQKLLDSYDLVHVPIPQHMHLIDHIKAKHLVTAHDFTHRLFPAYHTENNIRLSEDGMERALKNNAHFIAISNATANDLKKLYQVSSERTKVIYEGANGRFEKTNSPSATAILHKYGLKEGDKYFMSLSTIEPRKNIKGSLSAFELLKEILPSSDVKLLIGGKKGWKYDDLPIEEETLAEKGIFFTGFIPDNELPVLYNNAIALCYLSHYEGFGLPILEAMQSGTTVIYGNNSSMPEVVGEGGLGIDTNDIKAIAQAMQQLVENSDLRADLVKKAQIQSYKFSWLKTAFETLNYYEEVINK